MSAPRLFSIPAGVPFLPRLADALVAGELVPLGPDPETALASTTLFLPTRRAGRALHALLAERGGGRARILPRIVPLGEADAAEAGPDAGDDGLGASADLLPAIPPLERRLILTRLVQAWAKQLDPTLAGLPPGTEFRIPGTPADAVALAADLEELMDGLATEDVPWSDLGGAVDTDYSRYFRLTLDFVRIAHESWPAILAGRGAADPARRRNALLAAETARMASARHAGPVIAAGSTGSIPATARLIAAIARCPQGAVVLPGLDLHLDGAGWSAIGGSEDGNGPVHGHPQFFLRRLLEDFCGAGRVDVRELDYAVAGQGGSRRRLLSQAMRPAETTDSWAELGEGERAEIARGLGGLRIVEAADEREEALAIAIALREALTVPGQTAALVTPDRALARRVASELRRWHVTVEDSAGQPLGDSAPGRLARLAAETAASGFAPARLLALLAHPAVRFGRARAEIERVAATLEIGVLRGPAPAPGLGGLRAAFDLQRRQPRDRHAPAPRARLGDGDWAAAATLLDELDATFTGFAPPADPNQPVDLVALAGAHAAVLERLTGEQGCLSDGSLAQSALARLFDELATVAPGGVPGRFAEYPAFFAALARTRTVPPIQAGTHPRVRILGLLEARLLHADRIVLGGLDEGVWPPAATADAFLNRPMRERLGLTPPERRVGQTAHDFVQLVSGEDAVVTRAAKREGKPTVRSRFLARLRALAGDDVWSGAVARGRRFLDLAALLDKPRAVAPIRRPQPRPGPEAFPDRLSVTAIETLVRDPYAIYARHVLRLDPLDALATVPGAADFGTLLHGLLADFVRAHPGTLPPDAANLFLTRAEEALAPYAAAYPELVALWRPRLRRLAPDYVAWETERRAAGFAASLEVSGAMDIPLSRGAFTLTARADRIDVDANGNAAIVDFKTGGVPSDKEVAVGFAPQLTLEAAMLQAGAFRDLPRSAAVPALAYVKIGSRDPLTERVLQPPAKDGRTMTAIVDDHRRGLEATVRRYAETDTPYLSRPYPKYARADAPYDHLARVAEWSASQEESGE